MSLINDALKRARRTPKPPANETSGEAPLQPVESSEANSKSGRSLLPLLGVVALLVAGWFFWQWWTGSDQSPQQAASSRPTTNRFVAAVQAASNVVNAISNRTASAMSEITNVMVAAAPETNAPPTTNRPPAIAAVTNAAAVIVQNATGTNESAGAAASPAAQAPSVATNINVAITSPVPTPPRNVNFAPMQLQAIYFRISKPSVLINNRTLYVGDEIEGARVVAIERHNVRLEMSGRTKELTLK